MSNNGGVLQQIDAVTVQGVASAPFNIAQVGLLDIRATSDLASSVVLTLDVSKGGFSVAIATPTEINQPTPTPTVTPTPTPVETSPLEKGYPGFGGWFAMVLVLGGFGYLAYWLGDRLAERRWGVRWSICVVLGGLLTYTYLAIRLPGSTSYLQKTGWLGMIGVVLIGALIGGVVAYAWFRLVRESKKRLG
jgi:hypothetical protein